MQQPCRKPSQGEASSLQAIWGTRRKGFRVETLPGVPVIIWMPPCSCCLAILGSVPPTMSVLRMVGVFRCLRMSDMTSCTCCARSLHERHPIHQTPQKRYFILSLSPRGVGRCEDVHARLMLKEPQQAHSLSAAKALS